MRKTWIIWHKSSKENNIPLIAYATLNNQKLDNSNFKFDSDITIISNEYNEKTNNFEILLSDYPTKIGDNFCNAENLSYIDFSLCNKIESIGFNFLTNSSITNIDLSPFKNVKSIGYNFLTSTKIESIDLSPLQNLESLGNRFLDYCSLLTYVDLSPLKYYFDKYKVLPQRFLSGMKLDNLYWSILDNVESLGDYAFEDARMDNTSELFGHCKNVKHIGTGFYYGGRIGYCGLSPLNNVENIGINAFTKAKINYLDLTDFTNVDLFFSQISCWDCTIDTLKTNVNLPIANNNFRPHIINLLLTNENELLEITSHQFITIDNIFVPELLLEQYKSKVPKFAELFKPLSEYNGEA